MNDLEPRYRGSANSTNSFLRSFGMTLGVTIFGTIQTNVFTNKLTDSFSGMKGAGGAMQNIGNPQEIFQAGTRAHIPPHILDRIIDAMSQSITYVFTLALTPIAIAAVTILFMGKARVKPLRKWRKSELKKQYMAFVMYCFLFTLRNAEREYLSAHLPSRLN